jgi:hypothetical protein
MIRGVTPLAWHDGLIRKNDERDYHCADHSGFMDFFASLPITQNGDIHLNAESLSGDKPKIG